MTEVIERMRFPQKKVLMIGAATRLSRDIARAFAA